MLNNRLNFILYFFYMLDTLDTLGKIKYFNFNELKINK